VHHELCRCIHQADTANIIGLAKFVFLAEFREAFSINSDKRVGFRQKLLVPLELLYILELATRHIRI